MLDAFSRLRNSAGNDMTGRKPVSVPEVLAYCELCGMTDTAERIRLLDAVLAMDAAVRDFDGKA